MSRPGANYVAQTDQVTLAPAPELAERGLVATFHGSGGHDWARLAGPVDVYVDITTRRSGTARSCARSISTWT